MFSRISTIQQNLFQREAKLLLPLDRERQILYALTYVKSEKTKQTKSPTEIIDTEDGLVVANTEVGGRSGVGEMGEVGSKVQTCTYQTNTSWGCNVQHGDCR